MTGNKHPQSGLFQEQNGTIIAWVSAFNGALNESYLFFIKMYGTSKRLERFPSVTLPIHKHVKNDLRLPYDEFIVGAQYNEFIYFTFGGSFGKRYKVHENNTVTVYAIYVYKLVSGRVFKLPMINLRAPARQPRSAYIAGIHIYGEKVMIMYRHRRGFFTQHIYRLCSVSNVSRFKVLFEEPAKLNRDVALRGL
jgi:hypothetical protein